MTIATIIICSIAAIAGFVMVINYLVKENFLLYMLFVLLTAFNFTAVVVSIRKLTGANQDIKQDKAYYQIVTNKTLITQTDTTLVKSDTTYLPYK